MLDGPTTEIHCSRPPRTIPSPPYSSEGGARKKEDTSERAKWRGGDLTFSEGGEMIISGKPVNNGGGGPISAVGC